jgi:hypothetical protein
MLLALKKYSSKLEILGYVDSDGAFSLSDILRLEEITRENNSLQMIWSSRVALSGNDIRRSLKRHYLGRVISTLIWAGQNQSIYDTQSGLKFIPTPPNFDTICSLPFNTRWFVDLEILVRWSAIVHTRPSVREIPLSFWQEKPGSKVKINQGVRILKELIYIKKENNPNYYNEYIHLQTETS